VLFNEPKLLKFQTRACSHDRCYVSVLFNEPKLLKSTLARLGRFATMSFSALQRAEIAEIAPQLSDRKTRHGFSALQRAEIAEIREE